MRSRFAAAVLTAAAMTAVFAIATRGARGQTPARGQAAAAAYAPGKLPNGQPDLQGVWRIWNLAKYDLEDHSASPGVPAGKGFVVDPPDGRIPYLPGMREKRIKNFENSQTSDPLKSADPLDKCYIPGVPRATYLGWPFQILQTDKYVAFIYEWMHERRFAYFDPKGRMQGVDFWSGDSRGHFEGNTLVVDVASFNNRTWFDMAGNFHSEALHVVERYTPTGPDTLQYEARIEDPKVFSRPWTIRMTAQRQKDVGILDYECHALLDEMGYPLTWERE
jgi:hypothetical protein